VVLTLTPSSNNKWTIKNPISNRRGGVYPITPTKKVEKEVIEHVEAFYFWIESMLSINKIDTDAEIRKRFLERMGDDEATFYLGQRKKALKEGVEFKLERFGVSKGMDGGSGFGHHVMFQDKLDEILEAHRIWVESNGVVGKRAFLRFADLRGLKFHGATLQGANLTFAFMRGLDLEGVNFNDAKLEGADLCNAYLRDASFIDADLSRADLTGADISYAFFISAKLEGADLGNTKQDGTTFPVSWVSTDGDI